MARQPIVIFTKPESLGKREGRMPLVGKFEPAIWDKYRLANEKIGVDAGNLSVMQFFMRTMGESNGFMVLAARRGQFSGETFARHYQHTWKYEGAIEGKGWAVKNVLDYSAQPLWFFLVLGDHETAERIRGPSDGSQARDPKHQKFAPYTIRGIYGADVETPMLHMTAETPYNGGTLSAEECGRIEAVRFFGAGSIRETFSNWPIGKNGGIMLPKLEIKSQGVKYSYNRMRQEFAPGRPALPRIITRMLLDFPELTTVDFAEFFGRKAREILKVDGTSEPKIAVPGL